MTTTTTEKKAAKAKATRGIAPAAGPICDREFSRASSLLKNLSDATRLRIVAMLDEHGAMNVTEMCGVLMSSQPAVSHHLALLRVAGIIEPRRQGKNNYYSLGGKGRTLAGVVKAVVGAGADD